MSRPKTSCSGPKTSCAAAETDPKTQEKYARFHLLQPQLRHSIQTARPARLRPPGPARQRRAHRPRRKKTHGGRPRLHHRARPLLPRCREHRRHHPRERDGVATQIRPPRETGQAATSGTATFHSVTAQEDAYEEALLTAVQTAQARAKSKYEEADPAKLKGYWIGERIKSRARIEQAAAGIYSLIRTTDDKGNPVTPKDTLPGLTPALIAQLKTGSENYTNIQTTQTEAQGGASTARASLTTNASKSAAADAKSN